MHIGPRAPDPSARASPTPKPFHPRIVLRLSPTPQTRHFVLARAARRALRSDQVASRRSIATAPRSRAGWRVCRSPVARRSTTPPPPPAPPAHVRLGETGLASWYGHPYHGRPAANGEIYDMEKLTAAHRTLPFGTWVRVVNLSNDKTVDVRIIDRGPFVEGRIIDLSHAAAEAIGLIGPGVARVRLDILSLPTARLRRKLVCGPSRRVSRSRSRRTPARVAGTRVRSARIWCCVAGSPSLWRVLVGQRPIRGSRQCSGRTSPATKSVPPSWYAWIACRPRSPDRAQPAGQVYRSCLRSA